jgi:hypothetical protein
MRLASEVSKTPVPCGMETALTTTAVAALKKPRAKAMRNKIFFILTMIGQHAFCNTLERGGSQCTSRSGLILFHLIFVWVGPLRLFGVRPFDEIQWKKADYWYLGLTSLSLITAVGTIRERDDANLYKNSQPSWQYELERIRNLLDWRIHYHCDPLPKSELSPSILIG